jgi:cobaltochelatase CobS
MSKHDDILDSVAGAIDDLVRANGSITTQEPTPEAPPEVVKVVTKYAKLKAPAHYAKGAMFSKVFGKVPKGVPDIPVPLFKVEDWPKAGQAVIPRIDINWVWDRDLAYELMVAMLAGDTTLLYGETGTGKTALAEQACALLNIPLWQTSCHRQQESTDLLGSTGLEANEKGGMNTVFNPSQVVNSVLYGGMCLLDEAFRSPILMAIQPLLEEQHRLLLADANGIDAADRVLCAREGKFFMVLTDNTNGTGSESGVYDAEVQDLSTLDRVLSAIHVDYPKDAVQQAILKRSFDEIVDTDLVAMVQVGNQVRQAFRQGTLQQTMSLRALHSWATKARIFGNLRLGFKQAFLNKLTLDERSIAAEIWQQVTGEEL